MDFSRAWKTIVDMVNGAIATFPTLILSFVIFLLFYLIAKKTRELVIRMTDKRQKAKNLGLILGKLSQGAVVVSGLLIALTLVFPSFRPGDLIQLLGIGSVAIGFAFHDLFQNFLAGILLLLTSPFKLGDQISVENYEGTVEDIHTRATTIKTYDGRRIVIPNAALFTNSVTVHTAFERRRMEYEIGISYDDDINQAKGIILEALNGIDGVMEDPPAEALVVALAESSVTVRVYWWTMLLLHADVQHLQDKVLIALKNKLAENGITLPMPTQQILLQTVDTEAAPLTPLPATTVMDGV
ncbi:MAG: mechanosensitive ion channel family protein [Ktedonobacteraceae bacterium]|nr:mechanosensitive ion channel family protein [Ktedonobacteraceae bacterium]MBO0790894.1 mechanosensitive ion channel family protein [Ktedonobacteraceae bacterium]